MHCIVIVLGLLGSASVGAAEPIKFSAGPMVTPVTGAKEQSRLSFTVSQPTDVEVVVLNAKGLPVRHLAAGMLGGKNPPPAPLKPGLAQELVWDGRNDLGQPAEGGPFQLRVRAGLSVSFGRTIGGSPYTGSIVSMPYRAPVNGLVVDDEGTLFVKLMSSIGSHGNSGMWPWHVRKFDRSGKYLRTLLPYASSTPADLATGIDLLPADIFTPANRTSLYPVFATFGNEIVSRLSQGQLVFVHTEKRQLNFFAVDGSNRVKTVPMWSAKSKVNIPSWLDVQVALSPDGKTAYYANVAGVAYDGKHPDNIDPNWPQGRIYKHDLTKPDEDPVPFYDIKLPDFEKTKYWMPSAWDKKSASSGIDTDAKGNILVGDLVNQQVHELSPEGKLLSSTAVAWPDKVLVSRKTGTLYVISRKVSRGQLPTGTLYKITGRGEQAKVVAELALPGTIGGAYTLDETGPVPALWLAGQVEEKHPLLRVEDRGEKLEVVGDSYLNRDANAISFVGYMDIDREAELLYVTKSGGTVWRFQGETGEGGPIALKAVDLAIGPGGHVYTWGVSGSYEGPIGRFTRELKPAPLPDAEKHTYGQLYGRAGRGSSVCGMDVDLRGKVYATWGTNDCHVRVYDEKGNLLDFPRKQKLGEKGNQEVPVAISGVIGYGGSLRVDTAGNLYLLQAGLPKNFPVPEPFAKDEAYRHALGTIYKFPPTGGEIKTQNWSVKEVVGSIAQYPECGPVSRWQAVGSCACTKPRFDVDDWGRLFIPNALTYSVSVRDNADNEILRFGGYGNLDSQGPNSRETKPEIPLGWPVAVSVSDKYIYVGDCLNHRVVRVDKKYAVESVLKLGGKE